MQSKNRKKMSPKDIHFCRSCKNNILDELSIEGIPSFSMKIEQMSYDKKVVKEFNNKSYERLSKTRLKSLF